MDLDARPVAPQAQALAQAQVVAQIEVHVEDRQTACSISVDDLVDLLRCSLAECGVRAPAEVGLAFVELQEMAELNISHMGGEGATDVLAFPLDGTQGAPAGQTSLVGDIIICPQIAARAEQNLADELALLVVHGALHLVGHDHAEAEERAVMQALEGELLAAHQRR